MQFLALEPEAHRCPVEGFTALRERAPVVEIAEAGMFVVTGREEALEAFRDVTTFSSGQHANVETARNMSEMLRRASIIAKERGEFPDLLDGAAHPAVLPHVDAPAHVHQRQAVQPAFTVRR